MIELAGHKFELKRISFNARLSEETNAYAADLYVDGKLLAHVSNNGHGGCDSQHPAKGRTFEDISEIEKKLATVKCGGEFPDLDQSLEIVCGDLLAAWQDEKQVKRLTKGKIAWLNEKNELYTAKLPAGRTEAEALPHYKAKHPNARFLNGEPLAKQLELMRQAA